MFNFTRRSFLAASAGASFFPWSRLARSRESSADERLWYVRPSARWDDALPIGNGRLGAMVFGRVGQERLQLNEKTLYAGAPYVPESPDALAALPEVRRLIAEGRHKEAEELASAKIMARPLQQMPYGTLGDLLIDFARTEAPSNYERSLDLETAIVPGRAQKFTQTSLSVTSYIAGGFRDQRLLSWMTALGAKRPSPNVRTRVEGGHSPGGLQA